MASSNIPFMPVFTGNIQSWANSLVLTLSQLFSGLLTNPVPTYTYATLPTGKVGMVVYISDATTNTWGANITAGGGSDKVLAWFNSANWTVVGK